jgi:hypothetical protein
MNIAHELRRCVLVPALLAAALTAAPVLAADPAPVVNDDGLVEVAVENVDAVYRRPGVNWAGYTKVLIAPVAVSFSKSWNPRDYGAFGLRAADVDRIRRELATLAQDTFGRVLSEGGYTVVEAADEGVLRVEPDIVNLFINAPDPMEPGRLSTYVLSAGEMTLVIELRDSVTGTVLAQARDRKRGTDYNRLTLANAVFNRQEAERMLRGWAQQLRRNLDAARRAP